MLGSLRMSWSWLIPDWKQGCILYFRAQEFCCRQQGATAIEYGLIAVFVITALTTIGTNLLADFTSVATVLR